MKLLVTALMFIAGICHAVAQELIKFFSMVRRNNSNIPIGCLRVTLLLLIGASSYCQTPWSKLTIQLDSVGDRISIKLINNSERSVYLLKNMTFINMNNKLLIDGSNNISDPYMDKTYEVALLTIPPMQCLNLVSDRFYPDVAAVEVTLEFIDEQSISDKRVRRKFKRNLMKSKYYIPVGYFILDGGKNVIRKTFTWEYN